MNGTVNPGYENWDCAVGTPEEDHYWFYEAGDFSVGIEGAWVCRVCGKVDESDREPPEALPE